MKSTIALLRVCALFVLVLIQGCTTAKIAKGAVEEAGRGNVFSALYLGTLGVAVGGIYDVVSLGGTLSPDEAGEVTRSAVAVAADRQAQRNATPASPKPTSVQPQSSSREPGLVASPTVNGSMQSSSRTASTSTATASTGSSGCRTNLYHLAPRLPQYRVHELQETRSVVLAEDINAALSKARAMGYSPAAAASSSLQSARNAEAEVEKAKACIHGFATNPSEVITQLEQGRFNFSGTRMQDLGIHESCAASYVVLKYSAIANREMAVQLACLASAR